jgi:LysM repeat protein
VKSSYHEYVSELFVSLAALLAVLVPFSVHAGIFDVFFDTASANVESSFINTDSAESVALLKAPIHADPLASRGGGDVLVEDGVLMPSGDVRGGEARVNTKTSNGEISVYTVREGDTLSQIAVMFDVSAKTILWANDIQSATKIRPGDTLIILPITGVRHVVKSGDTIQSIAKKYSGDVDDILAYNQLTSGTQVAIGDTIIIPDGTIAQPTKTVSKQSSGGVSAGGGSFIHPLPGGIKTQGIHGYNGIDIGAPSGTAVRAAAGGTVIVARGSGWNGGYGLYVVIKHANGAQTLYAHLSGLTVASGDAVVAGQTIGYVGSTGRSTGNHLHFEVRGAKNPF